MAVVATIGLVLLVGPLLYFAWSTTIQPWWEARDLYRAANEALDRPYVEDAEVYLDWFDGNILTIYLTPGATASDAKRLWCDVLLGADRNGGYVEVLQGYSDEVAAPRKQDCP